MQSSLPTSELASPRVLRVAHPIVHLREKPSNGSERVSQTLLGHRVKVLREAEGWAWVETADTYHGWADLRWLRSVESDTTEQTVTMTFAEVRETPEDTAPLLTRLSQSAIVPTSAGVAPAGWVRVTLPETDEAGNMSGFVRASAFVPLPVVAPENIGAVAARYAETFRGTPYVWGGSSSFGLDCSGLAQFCYRLAGITLLRDADIQRDDERFVHVAPEEMLPGDLVFFGDERITHVGLERGNGSFIHSAGGAGVIVSKWGDSRYSPKFIDARRLDPARAYEPVVRFESETR